MGLDKIVFVSKAVVHSRRSLEGSDSLIGIGNRIEEESNLLDASENTGGHLSGKFALFRIPCTFKRKADGQTRSVLVEQGLGQKRCKQIHAVCGDLDDVLELHKMVCGFQKRRRTEADFVLAGTLFVMAGHIGYSQLLHVQADLTPDVLALVDGGCLEVGGTVHRNIRRVAFGVFLEQVEFDLCSCMKVYFVFNERVFVGFEHGADIAFKQASV